MYFVRITTDNGVYDSTEFKRHADSLKHAVPIIKELRERGEIVRIIETLSN